MNLDKERELFSDYIKDTHGHEVQWLDGTPIAALDLMMWNLWLASVSRDGCKMVPVEPNKEMVYAGESAEHNGCISVAIVYKAMLGAVE